MLRRAGAGTAFGPAARDLVLLAYTALILNQSRSSRRLEARADRLHLGDEVFLKASTANSFWA